MHPAEPGSVQNAQNPPDPDGHLDRIRAEHQPIRDSVSGCTCGWPFTTTHATHLAYLLDAARSNLAFTARGWMP